MKKARSSQVQEKNWKSPLFNIILHLLIPLILQRLVPRFWYGPWSLYSPKKQKPVPPTPVLLFKIRLKNHLDLKRRSSTALQNKIEKSLSSQMSLQLKQEMGIFQSSVMEAFNKLSNQQRSLQEQINKPRASATVAKPPLHSVYPTLYQAPVKSRIQI